MKKTPASYDNNKKIILNLMNTSKYATKTKVKGYTREMQEIQNPFSDSKLKQQCTASERECF